MLNQLFCFKSNSKTSEANHALESAFAFYITALTLFLSVAVKASRPKYAYRMHYGWLLSGDLRVEAAHWHLSRKNTTFNHPNCYYAWLTS